MTLSKTVSAGTLSMGGQALRYIDLRTHLAGSLHRFPWLIRILIENVLRNVPGGAAENCAPFVDWLKTGNSQAEISFSPGRLLMHDTTCVPALVDMAAMRDVLAEGGGDPAALQPVLPIDISVDHSVAVDAYGTPSAMAFNMQREIERNAERFRLMKWAAAAFPGMRVHVPGTGIMHTMNLERLATVIDLRERNGMTFAVPDTLIGTDSHTPMINGIGVLAWGVGGIEAESVMFGMPIVIRIPDVIGVRLRGKLSEGILSTDLALTVTERLRRYGLSGQFVEFFGPGVSSLSAGDRAVIANMAPEYGASSGFFPIDENTIRYLAATGRPAELQDRVRQVSRRQGLWFCPDVNPRYSDVIEIDLSRVRVCVAGPRLPQERLPPGDVRRALEGLHRRSLRPAPTGDGYDPPDGAVAIAAITSCTNTSDPRLLLAAGLVARKARDLGLEPARWVKTSLAPGSPAASRYLERSGLLDDLAAMGFQIVGYGCTTCIGNSGPLEASMSAAIEAGNAAAAVISGNRNFPGRVHPQIEASFLASPPMVVVFALAGELKRDITTDPIGYSRADEPVFLRDIWPSSEEIDEVAGLACDPGDVASAASVAALNHDWKSLRAPTSVRFPWKPSSTYVRRPPFVSSDEGCRLGKFRARPLLVLGDDVTTDHISPAGHIGAHSEAGRYLTERNEPPGDLNVFAARRGNWEVMLRGMFTNPATPGLFAENLPPGLSRHWPSGELLPVWQVARRYCQERVPVVLIAGQRYGTGSSRDWAAKGVSLLGVRAILASSFERIHRSNLIGMGVLPIRLPARRGPGELAVAAGDWFEIDAPASTLRPRSPLQVAIVRASGGSEAFEAVADIETEHEVSILRCGGMIPMILSGVTPEGGGAHPGPRSKA